MKDFYARLASRNCARSEKRCCVWRSKEARDLRMPVLRGEIGGLEVDIGCGESTSWSPQVAVVYMHKVWLVWKNTRRSSRVNGTVVLNLVIGAFRNNEGFESLEINSTQWRSSRVTHFHLQGPHKKDLREGSLHRVGVLKPIPVLCVSWQTIVTSWCRLLISGRAIPLTNPLSRTGFESSLQIYKLTVYFPCTHLPICSRYDGGQILLEDRTEYQ
ncbi:hypothetical protein PoB_006012000 [Plakobranchus ocellatus]|uniref:Uncharacterized protein n=1 Tax=Plakobranchus ocellatus TaxID=259542 RepID=A0AAV4CP13_9GAST|nr:hypothetical protein PoB_006012000 [Plakobranchus ocellatus]